MNDDFKTVLKFKKQFPFFYLIRRRKTLLETVFDNVQMAQDLLVVVTPVVVSAKIIERLRKHKNMED